MTRSLSDYAKVIFEISTLISDAGEMLVTSTHQERQFSKAESILRDAADKARTGLKSLARDQGSLDDEAASNYDLAFRRAQEAIAGWIVELRRNGVNCGRLCDLLPEDLLPPTSLPSA